MPRNNIEEIIQKGLSAQSFATVCFNIIPNDTNKLIQAPRGLYIGTGGNLSIIDKEGNESIFIDVPSGSILPVRPAIIKSTGTTAGNIIGMR